MRAMYLVLPLLLVASLHAAQHGPQRPTFLDSFDDLAGLPCNDGSDVSYLSYEPVIGSGSILYWNTKITCRQPHPVIQTSPESHSFTSSTVTTFTLTNVGIGAATLSNFQVTNSIGHFSISNNTCDGALLAPDQSCTFQVSWTPGCGVDSATVRWTNSGGTTGATSVAVQGVVIC